MKNLKRILAIILTVVMVVPMFLVGGAAQVNSYEPIEYSMVSSPYDFWQWQCSGQSSLFSGEGYAVDAYTVNDDGSFVYHFMVEDIGNGNFANNAAGIVSTEVGFNIDGFMVENANAPSEMFGHKWAPRIMSYYISTSNSKLNPGDFDTTYGIPASNFRSGRNGIVVTFINDTADWANQEDFIYNKIYVSYVENQMKQVENEVYYTDEGDGEMPLYNTYGGEAVAHRLYFRFNESEEFEIHIEGMQGRINQTYTCPYITKDMMPEASYQLGVGSGHDYVYDILGGAGNYKWETNAQRYGSTNIGINSMGWFNVTDGSYVMDYETAATVVFNGCRPCDPDDYSKHSFGLTGTVTIENGVQMLSRKCASCSWPELAPLSQCGHTSSEPRLTKNPDCAAKINGEYSYFCLDGDCPLGPGFIIGTRKYKYQDSHIYDYKVTFEPTCVAEGTETGTCVNCGKTITNSIEKTGHVKGDPVITLPTCTMQGSNATYCVYCNKQTSKFVIPEKGHTLGQASVTPATCTRDGVSSAVCNDCGETVDKVISATGHSFGDWQVTKEATDTLEGEEARTCGNCNEVETRVTPPLSHVHTPGEIEVITDPTCDSEGVGKATCTECGRVLDEAVVIPAKGHEGEWVIIQKPSETQDGTRVLRCNVCGDELSTEIIPAAPWQNPFDDVDEDAWYYEGVKYTAVNGYMNGTSATTFEPTKVLTRAQFVMILFNIEGVNGNNYTGNTKFSDVPAEHWAAKAIEWADKEALTSGVGEGKFAPANPVSRQTLAVFMMNYAAYKELSISATTDISSYEDADAVAPWALDAVKWSVAEGIFGSTSENIKTFEPKKTASRAVVARVVTVFVETVLNK